MTAAEGDTIIKMRQISAGTNLFLSVRALYYFDFCAGLIIRSFSV